MGVFDCGGTSAVFGISIAWIDGGADHWGFAGPRSPVLGHVKPGPGGCGGCDPPAAPGRLPWLEHVSSGSLIAADVSHGYVRGLRIASSHRL